MADFGGASVSSTGGGVDGSLSRVVLGLLRRAVPVPGSTRSRLGAATGHARERHSHCCPSAPLPVVAADYDAVAALSMTMTPSDRETCGTRERDLGQVMAQVLAA